MATQMSMPRTNIPILEPMSIAIFPHWRRRAVPRRAARRRGLIATRFQPQVTPQEAEFRRLVIKLYPLVKRVALQMRERLPLHVEVEDLVSTGVLGLVDAIRKFDARKQVTLERYAQHRIRGAILDGLRGLDTASRDMRKKNKKAERVYSELEAKLARPPDDEEMARGLGISLAGWYRTVRELQSVGIEWLRPMGSAGAREAKILPEDALPAGNQGHQFDACYRREQQEVLDLALARIPPRERLVVRLYYQQELNMRQIGERMGIDESRVSQLHSVALTRLRKRVSDLLKHPPRATPCWAW